MQAQVFTLGYLKGSEEETAHKRYTAAELEKEHDTVELCMACPCTQRASANIDAFPSAIVLPKQKLQDHSLEKNSSLTSPPSLPPSPSLIASDRHSDSWNEHFSWSWKDASGQHLLHGSSEPQRLLKRFVAMLSSAVPFSFQCSRSALPPVICTLSSLQSTCWQLLNVRGVTTAAAAPGGGGWCSLHTVFSCHYSLLLSCTIKMNICGE